MKTRNHAFDLLCGICIVRMIMLHITCSCAFETADWWTAIMDWTYFFMSFFFFKAGYFNKKIDGDSKEFLVDKTRRLIVPYLSWGWISNAVFFFFVFLILPAANPHVKSVSWEHVWQHSDFYGNRPLWFLFSFYMMYVIVHLISKIPPLVLPKIGISLHATWVIMLFPLLSYWLYTKDNPLIYDLNNVFFGAFLFELGRVWRKVVDRVCRRNVMLISAVMLAVFCCLTLIYGGQYSMSDNKWNGSFLPLFVSVVCVLCGLSGILLSVRLPRIPLIGYIGEHSMTYFVSHQIIITFYLLLKSSNVHTLKHHWDDYIILTILCFSLCTMLVPFMERIPWLSGRYHKKPGKLWII